MTSRAEGKKKEKHIDIFLFKYGNESIVICHNESQSISRKDIEA